MPRHVSDRTRDLGVAPFLRRPGGAFDKTRAPAYLVDFEGAAHLAWTDLNSAFQSTIVDYSVAFLNRYVNGDSTADPGKRQNGVADLRVKKRRCAMQAEGDRVIVAWRTNDAATRYLVERLPSAAWTCEVPGYHRKTVGMIAAHILI